MIRTLLVLAAFLAVVPLARADDGAAKVEWTIGLSHAAFTTEFETRTKAGFRPVRVSTAAVDRQFVNVAQWEARRQPRFSMQLGLTTAEFEAKHAELQQDGYLLVDFGSVFGDDLKHHGIWEERNGPDLTLRLDLDAAELAKVDTESAGQGFRLRSLGVAAGTKEVRYSGVWEETEAEMMPAREFDLDVPFARVRGVVTRRTRMGFRCLDVFGTEVEENERYTFLWEKADGPPQRVQVRLTNETLATERKQWEADRGHRLRAVNVYELRKISRYAAVWDGPARAE